MAANLNIRPLAVRMAWALLCTVPVSACRRDDSAPREAAGEHRVKVALSIPPQAYFVERVGGRHVKVIVLVGPGQSPATFDPTLKQVAEFSRADLYFQIGVAFENRLLPRLAASNPRLRVVDTRRGIQLLRMEQSDNHGHDPADAEGHDPHIWLDPRRVKVQARIICDALKAEDPAHADDYERNLAAFHRDLDRLHARLAEILLPMRGRPFFVFHPAFGYLADAYGLRQVAVEAGGKEPTGKRLSSLIARAAEAGVKQILVQRQFASERAEAVAEAIGASVITVDPLARDYPANLLRIAAAIAESATPPTPAARVEGAAVPQQRSVRANGVQRDD